MSDVNEHSQDAIHYALFNQGVQHIQSRIFFDFSTEPSTTFYRVFDNGSLIYSEEIKGETYAEYKARMQPKWEDAEVVEPLALPAGMILEPGYSDGKLVEVSIVAANQTLPNGTATRKRARLTAIKVFSTK
jgi:hypothetical protein